ncbi:hypothetical protein P3833_29980, partial [Pseudomonas aeruginosa]|nr:hypothetical protein [Pseudomonas aeruginosa]
SSCNRPLFDFFIVILALLQSPQKPSLEPENLHLLTYDRQHAPQQPYRLKVKSLLASSQLDPLCIRSNEG